MQMEALLGRDKLHSGEYISLPTNHSDSSGHLSVDETQRGQKKIISPSCKCLLLDTPWVAKGLSAGKTGVCCPSEQIVHSKTKCPVQIQRLLFKESLSETKGISSHTSDCLLSQAGFTLLLVFYHNCAVLSHVRNELWLQQATKGCKLWRERITLPVVHSTASITLEIIY